MVDDLKDVLSSAEEAGKTVARDLLLDHPNIATAIGVPQTIEILRRYLKLGDWSLARLQSARPAMAFLGKLRNDLQGELQRVTQSAQSIDSGVHA